MALAQVATLYRTQARASTVIASSETRVSLLQVSVIQRPISLLLYHVPHLILSPSIPEATCNMKYASMVRHVQCRNNQCDIAKTDKLTCLQSSLPSRRHCPASSAQRLRRSERNPHSVRRPVAGCCWFCVVSTGCLGSNLLPLFQWSLDQNLRDLPYKQISSFRLTIEYVIMV
jgi:hypothetical protein